MSQRRGSLLKSLFVLVLCGAVVYAVVVALGPWAVHIGGRSTPLLYWHGSGKLRTKGGAEYPLYVLFYPSPTFSRLQREGLRPTGGLQGSAWLCTSRGVTQRLKLSGTIYGGWSSTEGSLMAFRLLEPKPIDLGQGQGYFDLAGKWRGPQLVMDDHPSPPKAGGPGTPMDDRGSVGGQFRSGLRIEHPSVTLDWEDFRIFEAVCANKASSPR
ncbi:MAG TPA: hypothetical protein VKL40_16680 [Candidatus Angelobacter sp.]|nr:hypothetical protein [Candidatus Angelobacter sp.]